MCIEQHGKKGNILEGITLFFIAYIVVIYENNIVIQAYLRVDNLTKKWFTCIISKIFQLAISVGCISINVETKLHHS